MTSRFPLHLVVMLALICAPTIAAADDFYDAYQRGMAAFRAKEYMAARAEFQRAYDLRPEPIVLFNIAQTYRLAGDEDQALLHYRRFLSESQIAEDLRAEAQRHVTELEGAARARAATRAADAHEGPREPDGTAVTVAEPPVDRPRPTETVGDVARETKVEGSGAASADVVRRRRVPTASWVAFGVGGAGAAGGVVLGILGKRAESDLQRNPNATQADADRVETYETAINVSWGVAVTATVAGAVIYVVAPSYRTDRRLVVAPTDGGWAAALSGRF